MTRHDYNDEIGMGEQGTKAAVKLDNSGKQ